MSESGVPVRFGKGASRKVEQDVLERERRELDLKLCWFGYEIMGGQDTGSHVVFTVRRRKVGQRKRGKE